MHACTVDAWRRRTSAIRLMFSLRLFSSKPRSLLSPKRTLSPSRRYAASPRCSRCCSSAVAIVDLPDAESPVNQMVNPRCLRSVLRSLRESDACQVMLLLLRQCAAWGDACGGAWRGGAHVAIVSAGLPVWTSNWAVQVAGCRLQVANGASGTACEDCARYSPVQTRRWHCTVWWCLSLVQEKFLSADDVLARHRAAAITRELINHKP
jgi:hypothetical protein